MRGTEMIEEDKRADHATFRKRQYTPDLESTEIAAALLNHQLQRHD
jgi:hypothetical protein